MIFTDKRREHIIRELTRLLRENDDSLTGAIGTGASGTAQSGTRPSGKEQTLAEIALCGHRTEGSLVNMCGGKRTPVNIRPVEEKHRENEEFVRRVLETVEHGFIDIDRDFRILTANEAYCRQTGRVSEEVIGRHCYEISHKAARPCYEEGEECAARTVFATGKPHAVVHRHSAGDGRILFVEVKGYPVKDASGNVVSVIEAIDNITERYLIEEERLRTQKLEAIGTLAGGIAHDFNNLLQGIFGYISMAKRFSDDKEKSLSMLSNAENLLQESASLTKQLLTFSKGGKPVRQKIDPRSVVENSVKFALSGSRAEYRIRTDERLWTVEADEGQLSQVIQNIVLNAAQAMPLGGNITVSVYNVSAPASCLPLSLEPGRYLEITVSDTGIGIPEEYLPRIFDPYFTTKDKGSGLGLATSYSIIRNHGGQINVKSEQGSGTTVNVYIPATDVEESKPAPSPVKSGNAARGYILVMDDEEVIRNIAGVMIQSLGHEVDFAENGDEAVSKYREALSAGKRFGVVVLDLTIRGGKGGKETLQELKELDPEVTAVVSSGYSDDAVVAEYRAHGFSACLKKPYEIDTLKDTLDSLLK